MDLLKSQLYTKQHYSRLLQDWPSTQRISSTIMYVPIPKNAHTWLKTNLTLTHTPSTVQDRYLILIRDPINRWITGMATYCRTLQLFKDNYWENTAPDLERMLGKNLILDGHTVPQSYFLRNTDPSRCDVLEVNHSLPERVNSYLNLQLNPTPINASSTGYQQYLIQHITEYALSQPQVMHKLNQLLEQDYPWLERARLPLTP